MSTLHQHHWHSRETLNDHLAILTTADTLVIYGWLTDQDNLWLQDNPALSTLNWYLVISEPRPYMSDRLIDHAQWLQLIAEHDNTFAWKN